VKREMLEAKFWLEPLVQLAQNWGFARHELNDIRRIVEEHQHTLLEKWNEHFGKA
jgi:7,8-dihydro-6-hydroxymethylpterin-pyrophosphokinase